MNEELDYAEMLDIPVETVTVSRKERKKRRDDDLQEQLVSEVNERMERNDPAYAESTPIAREEGTTGKNKRARRIIVAEFVAVCALLATIFLTNIFLTDSAINTFVRGLFNNGSAATATDTRVYSDFKLTGLFNDSVNTEISVSPTGVLSFTANCSVYPPCGGEIVSVGGNAESGYSVEIRHSDVFSTIMSGLDSVYPAKGDSVKANLPLGYTDGNGEVRVMFYQNGTLLNACTVEGTTLQWS